MADNENVTIRINVKADTAAIDRVQKRLAALCAQADKCGDTFEKLGKAFDDNEKSTSRNTKESDKLRKTLSGLSKAGEGFAKVLKKGFMLALKGTVLETAALAAALSSVNLLLKTGQLLSRAWNASVRGIGVAAANAAAGIAALAATFAAAMRQFQAAQSSASYGGSFKATSTALRTMQSDTQLAVFGIKSLTSAFAAASRNAPVTGATVKNLRGLADFAVASGDMEKGLAAAANLVSLLQSGKGAGSEGVLKAATELGPQFEKAFKEITKSGKVTNDQLLKMFSSGEFAQRAGVAGTAQNVRQSLVGQLKMFGTEMQVQFADLGMTFIQPVQEAFNRIRVIVNRTLVQIAGNLGVFSQGTFVDSLVKIVDKLATLTATLFNEYLPKTGEVVNNFVNKWNKFTGAIDTGFKKFERFLNRFSAASAEINKFFGAIFKAIGGGFRGNFESFSDLITKNSENFQEFGTRIGELISTIFDLFREMRESFFKALPVINKIVGALTALVGVFVGLANAISNLGPIMATLAFGGLGVGTMAMTKKGRGRLGAAGRGARAAGGYLAANPLLAGSLAAQAIPGAGGDILSAALMGGFVGGQLPTGVGKAFDKIAPSSKALNAKGFKGMVGRGRNRIAGRLLSASSMGGGALMAGGAIAAGGAVATSKAIDFMENRFGSDAANIATGALGGALTGAAVGSVVPVIGTAVGTLIGGALGAIGGFLKSGAAKKKARKAGENFANGYSDQLRLALQHGAIDQAMQLADDFDSNLRKATQGMNRASHARGKADEIFQQNMEEIQPVIDQFNRNLNDLQKMTGKSKDEIIAAAQAAEVDLGSNLKDLQTIMLETGLVVGQFGDDFNVAISTALGTAIEAMQTSFDVLEAPRIMDEAATALQQAMSQGPLSDQDRLGFLQTVFTQAQIRSGGDPLAAAQYIRENIGTAAAPGMQFTTPGARLYGTQAEFFAGGGREMLGAGYGSIEADLRNVIQQNIISEVARVGGAIDVNALSGRLGGLGFDALLAMAQQVREGGFLSQVTSTVPKQGTIDRSGLVNQQLMDIVGVNLELQASENEQFLADYGTETQKLISGFGLALDPLEEGMATFNTNIGLLIEAVKGGDTSSPRSSLVDTMTRHNAFDMAIKGKRTVTSSLRNNMLGSPSSDHASGRAYDLIGQNLGMYKTAVQAAGGYADFHGAGGSRHLHVVPGNGPVGDTTTPYFGGTATAAPVVNSNDSYNIVVNASPGMDVKALADEVMTRISKIQRNSAERTR